MMWASADTGVPLHQGHCFCIMLRWVDPTQYQIQYTHVLDTKSSCPVKDSLDVFQVMCLCLDPNTNVSRNQGIPFPGFCAPVLGCKSSQNGIPVFCLWPHINTAVVLLQVFYYADRIFQSAGVDNNNVQYVTVSIGAINVVMTLIAVSFY